MNKLRRLVFALTLVFVGVATGAVEWDDCLRQRAGWYSSGEAVRVGDNVLLYQRGSGGWPKNTEMAAVLSEAENANLRGQKGRTDSTIDNGATCRQLRYLGKVCAGTGEARFKKSFLKGVDYLLEAQYANGGWPQFYPEARGYSRHITFNDGAMVNVMTLLREVGEGKGDFAFVDDKRRRRAKLAVEKGIECILKCQIVHGGRRLGWCAQHDEKTFEPRVARSYELASLSGSEGVGVVRFLMTIERPSAKIVAAIEDAVRWFDEAKITGIREIRRPAPGTRKGYDKVMVADSDARPIWARFYQIGTNKPIFCSRDGIMREKLADISYERRNGYSWYTRAPSDLLNRAYPEWAAKWTPQRNVLD